MTIDDIGAIQSEDSVAEQSKRRRGSAGSSSDVRLTTTANAYEVLRPNCYQVWTSAYNMRVIMKAYSEQIHQTAAKMWLTVDSETETNFLH